MHPWLRGAISNGVAGALLLAVSQAGHLEMYAIVALGVQWAVFFCHAMPKRSEVRVPPRLRLPKHSWVSRMP